LLITELDLKQKIRFLARQIYLDYKDEEELYFIYILDGAFIFAADLARELFRLGLPLIIGTIMIKTYNGINPEKNPIIRPSFNFSIKDKNVLIIEDILDTGNTINILNKSIRFQKPKSVNYCCLLKKNHDRCILKENISIKYIGFNIQDVFVIGYGLDMSGHYRELASIWEYHG